MAAPCRSSRERLLGHHVRVWTSCEYAPTVLLRVRFGADSERAALPGSRSPREAASLARPSVRCGCLGGVETRHSCGPMRALVLELREDATYIPGHHQTTVLSRNRCRLTRRRRQRSGTWCSTGPADCDVRAALGTGWPPSRRMMFAVRVIPRGTHRRPGRGFRVVHQVALQPNSCRWLDMCAPPSGRADLRTA